MRSELVDAMVALNSAHAALDRIPLGQASDVDPERIVRRSEGIRALRNELADSLTDDEWEMFDARLRDGNDAESSAEPERIAGASVREFYEDARVDSLNTVACGEWPAFDGSEWPSQTFLVGRLSQLLDSLTVDDEHVFSGPVRVSLPEFETHDADSGTVIAVETADGEVAVACPWTGDFDVDESEVDR